MLDFTNNFGVDSFYLYESSLTIFRKIKDLGV